MEQQQIQNSQDELKSLKKQAKKVAKMEVEAYKVKIDSLKLDVAYAEAKYKNEIQQEKIEGTLSIFFSVALFIAFFIFFVD
jgi:threonyl-tRNA synthetase